EEGHSPKLDDDKDYEMIEPPHIYLEYLPFNWDIHKATPSNNNDASEPNQKKERNLGKVKNKAHKIISRNLETGIAQGVIKEKCSKRR
ncbi:30487_t:CDS:2, partial [Gigaspora margarita]